MKITLNARDLLLADKASKLTKISDLEELINLGLKTLITNTSSQKLARLEGSQKFLKEIRRKRS